MANYIITNGIKWEYSISDDTIKLKTKEVIDKASIEVLFQHLFEKFCQENDIPYIQSSDWELKQISYGERAKEKNEYLDIIYDSLTENSFAKSDGQCEFYSTDYVRRPGYKEDFESFILKAVK